MQVILYVQSVCICPITVDFVPRTWEKIYLSPQIQSEVNKRIPSCNDALCYYVRDVTHKVYEDKTECRIFVVPIIQTEECEDEYEDE